MIMGRSLGAIKNSDKGLIRRRWKEHAIRPSGLMEKPAVSYRSAKAGTGGRACFRGGLKRETGGPRDRMTTCADKGTKDYELPRDPWGMPVDPRGHRDNYTHLHIVGFPVMKGQQRDRSVKAKNPEIPGQETGLTHCFEYYYIMGHRALEPTLSSRKTHQAPSPSPVQIKERRHPSNAPAFLLKTQLQKAALNTIYSFRAQSCSAGELFFAPSRAISRGQKRGKALGLRHHDRRRVFHPCSIWDPAPNNNIRMPSLGTPTWAAGSAGLLWDGHVRAPRFRNLPHAKPDDKRSFGAKTPFQWSSRST